MQLEQYIGKDIRPCVVCSGTDFEIYAKKDCFTSRECKKCGMISTNPYLNEEGLAKLYSEYLSYRLDMKEKTRQREIMYEIDRDWILNFISEGAVLDIGCSAGYFLSKFDKNRFDRNGTEVVAECAELAKNQFDIPVQVGNFVDLNIEKKYDLVMMRGVIEHIVDPLKVIQKVAKVTKTGGLYYICATPNGSAFAFDVYREKWGLYTPDHVHFFSLKHLNSLMESAGFKLQAWNYQYEETPYANPENDFKKIRSDIALMESGKGDQVTSSVPFPGSMLSAVWKKM